MGKVLHKARSGNLIIRLSGSKEIDPGTALVDAKGRPVAKVVELIGPVSSPYAAAVPTTSRVGKEGEKVFTK